MGGRSGVGAVVGGAVALLVVLSVPLVAPAGSTPRPALYELTISTGLPGGGQGISAIDPASGAWRPLAGFRDAREQRWSEDGRRVVYWTPGGLWLANADGKDARRLLKYWVTHPDWSADERSILFDCSDSKAMICSVPVAGGPVKRIFVDTLPEETSFFDFDVSRRDGEIVASRITDVALGDLRFDIVRMHADGSGFRTLTKRIRNRLDHAVWSPDGTKIAFAEQRLLRVMNADGSGKHRIHDVGPNRLIQALSWSPAGNLIAFETNKALWWVTSDGADLRRLTSTGHLNGLDWRRR